MRELIRKLLREQSEDFNTTIEDHEDGFDVFIMDGDKKIGEISFTKESIPNLYTIVDATIDDEYKGNRIYPKTIIDLFKERPNLIINSVFRSPEAEKSWRYILNNLPSNIGKSFKYYKDEDTTLIQLKLKKDIKESKVKTIKEEETKIPLKLRRRFDEIDWRVKFAVREFKAQQSNICVGFTNFFSVIIEKTCDSIYWDMFADDMDDSSKEWTEIYYALEEYLQEKYLIELQNYYHINCGD